MYISTQLEFPREHVTIRGVGVGRGEAREEDREVDVPVRSRMVVLRLVVQSIVGGGAGLFPILPANSFPRGFDFCLRNRGHLLQVVLGMLCAAQSPQPQIKVALYNQSHTFLV